VLRSAAVKSVDRPKPEYAVVALSTTHLIPAGELKLEALHTKPEFAAEPQKIFIEESASNRVGNSCNKLPTTAL
jgi:hypothetical protein